MKRESGGFDALGCGLVPTAIRWGRGVSMTNRLANDGPRPDTDVSSSKLPPLADTGHVTVVSMGWPPMTTGSAVVMANLFRNFDPSSFTVVTASNSRYVRNDDGSVSASIGIVSSLLWSFRLDMYWRDLQIPIATRKLIRIVRANDSKVLLAVYPDYHFFKIARDAAKATRVPLLPYFHDTLLEPLAKSRLGHRAARLQAQVFAEAANVLVMSRGMADLYERKYHLQTVPIEHTYPEPIRAVPSATPPKRAAFWAGSIYGINLRAARRIASALAKIKVPWKLTNQPPSEFWRGAEFDRDLISTSFFPSRNQYLAALEGYGLLVLALDAADESEIQEDELSTIFPTKTPEYLASGRPILVHCPDHYFLARFFRTNRCGVVVSDRTIDALAEACRSILDGESSVAELTKNALDVAKQFSASRIANRLGDEVQRASRARWGERCDAGLRP